MEQLIFFDSGMELQYQMGGENVVLNTLRQRNALYLQRKDARVPFKISTRKLITAFYFTRHMSDFFMHKIIAAL